MVPSETNSLTSVGVTTHIFAGGGSSIKKYTKLIVHQRYRRLALGRLVFLDCHWYTCYTHGN